MDDRERRNSIVDRINSLVNLGLNAYDAARLLARGARLPASAGRAVAGAGAAAATSEVWGPAIAIALVIVLVPTFITVLGGQGAGKELETQESVQIGDTSTLFTTTARDSAVSDSDFYNVLQEAFSYPTYTNLLTGSGPFNVEFNIPLDDFVGCSAAVVQRHTIQFYGFSNCTPFQQKYLALHESGHVLGNRNGDLYYSFPYSDLLGKDPACFSRLGHVRSYYYAEIGAGTNPFEESFAESITMSLIKQKAPFKDFAAECPNIYNWVRENILK